MFANLYSLVMFVAPTSVLLLISLSISDVKYGEWFKFIFKLVLTLLIVSFSVFMFMFGSLWLGIALAVLAIVVFILLNTRD